MEWIFLPLDGSVRGFSAIAPSSGLGDGVTGMGTDIWRMKPQDDI